MASAIHFYWGEADSGLWRNCWLLVLWNALSWFVVTGASFSGLSSEVYLFPVGAVIQEVCTKLLYPYLCTRTLWNMYGNTVARLKRQYIIKKI